MARLPRLVHDLVEALLLPGVALAVLGLTLLVLPAAPRNSVTDDFSCGSVVAPNRAFTTDANCARGRHAAVDAGFVLAGIAMAAHASVARRTTTR